MQPATAHLNTSSGGEALEELLDSADALLLVDNRIFPVHSQILTVFSGFFRHLFYDLGHPISSQPSSSSSLPTGGGWRDKAPLVVTQVSARDFQFLLKYLYSSDSSMFEKVLQCWHGSLLPCTSLLVSKDASVHAHALTASFFHQIDDAKVLADLAQRFDIPCILRNCVPWVVKCSTDFLMNAYSSHFDAMYWWVPTNHTPLAHLDPAPGRPTVAVVVVVNARLMPSPGRQVAQGLE